MQGIFSDNYIHRRGCMYFSGVYLRVETRKDIELKTVIKYWEHLWQADADTHSNDFKVKKSIFVVKTRIVNVMTKSSSGNSSKRSRIFN